MASLAVVDSGCVSGYLWFTLQCVCGETVHHTGFGCPPCECGRQLVLGDDYSTVTIKEATP